MLFTDKKLSRVNKMLDCETKKGALFMALKYKIGHWECWKKKIKHDYSDNYKEHWQHKQPLIDHFYAMYFNLLGGIKRGEFFDTDPLGDPRDYVWELTDLEAIEALYQDWVDGKFD